VRWVNLGDHTEGFRGSPAFTRWREIVGPFFRGAATGGARQRRRNCVNGRRNCVNVCRTAPRLLLRGAPPTPEAPLLALGVVLLLLAALAAVALTRSAAADPVGERALTVDVKDGPARDQPVAIDATLFTPALTPAPAVLLAHGFGGSKDSVADRARTLARDGFVVLTYSARGFGRTSGQIALNFPDYEVADAGLSLG